MTKKYKVVYGITSFERDGTDIVSDYVNNNNLYERSHTEVRIERLTQLIGNIADKLGINLLEVIDKHQLNEQYTYTKDE